MNRKRSPFAMLPARVRASSPRRRRFLLGHLLGMKAGMAGGFWLGVAFAAVCAAVVARAAGVA